MLLAALTAIIIVIGMRMMGAMLISSLIIFPALSAMRLCKNYKHVTICSAIISVVAYLFGMCISYLFSTPTGASVVITNLVVFIVFYLISKIRK